MSERKVSIEFSPELLAELLYLPKGSKIVDLRISRFYPEKIEFLVENDKFPERKEGELYPNALVRCHTKYNSSCGKSEKIIYKTELVIFEKGKEGINDIIIE
jgi:hypothetical protein